MTRAQVKQRARDERALWRLVLEGGLDYDLVFHRMTPERIRVANAALDLHQGRK